MIKGENIKWARMVFNPYEEYLLKKNFTGFYLTGTLPQIDTGSSLLITPNHFSWWDGFFIDFVSRKLLKRKFYVIMLEEQLRRYNFFSKLGAFSVNPDSLKSIKESLQYSEEILNDPGNLLVFYPQGSIEPFDKDTLSVKEGIHSLIRRTSAQVIPAAFRIEYNNQKNPSVFFRLEKDVNKSELIKDPECFRKIFNNNLRQLNIDVHEGRSTLNLFDKEI